jgi:chemotaxis family two-component system response regulator PixG
MNSNYSTYSKPVSKYLRVKKLQIFSVLKRLSFSGQLTWFTADDQQWNLFFNRGQVIYGSGGVHQTRRWYRQAQAHLPESELSHQALQTAAVVVPADRWLQSWDYYLLLHWRRQGRLSESALQAISTNIVADILFDVLQVHEVQYRLVRQPPLEASSVAMAVDDRALLPWVAELWEDWIELGLEAYSPNLAPVIQHPEPIQAAVSPRVYASLMQLLDGQRSLRDLAVKLGQDVLNLTQALQPYIQAGWITLEAVADFPSLRPTRGAGVSPRSPPEGRLCG